jgi:hypothetical protein
MSRKKFTDTIRFYSGFILSKPKIADTASGVGGGVWNYAAEGSANVLFLGQAEPVPFKGLALISGIGAITGQQVSDGIAGFVTASGDTDLNTVTQSGSRICGTQNPTVSVVSGELVIDNNFNESQGIILTGTYTTSGTFEFRFPNLTTVSSFVSLRYATAADCALLQDSAVDHGYDIYTSPSSSGTVSMNSRYSVGGTTTNINTETSVSASSVYKMIISTAGVRFYKNGTLIGTSPEAPSGASIQVFVRVDQNVGNLGKIVFSRISVY